MCYFVIVMTFSYCVIRSAIGVMCRISFDKNIGQDHTINLSDDSQDCRTERGKFGLFFNCPLQLSYLVRAIYIVSPSK
jgi:hypothetical protein